MTEDQMAELRLEIFQTIAATCGQGATVEDMVKMASAAEAYIIGSTKH